MRTTSRILLLAALSLCWLPFAAGASEPPDPGYARIDVDAVGLERLLEIQKTPGLAWWVELDDRLLVLASAAALDSLAVELAVERLPITPEPSRLYLLRGARRADRAAIDADVLAAGGRWAVVQARRNGPLELPREQAHHAALLPFVPDQVLARQGANHRPGGDLGAGKGPLGAMPSPRWKTIAPLIEAIDPQRWFNDVVALADYNRYTHGNQIDDARDWIVQQLETLPGLEVMTESFPVGGTTAYNVIATLSGADRPDEIYIIGGHYDSTSQSPQTAAPGAEDNASGCAGVLEMARIFTANPPDGTILFICYSGEEQDLLGSIDHASRLVDDGLADRVAAVLIMDMVGFTEDADLDCLLETNSANAALADVFAEAAALTELRIVISYSPFGSDHMPYLNRGMPALLVIENDWATYPCYHRTCDLPANLTLAMGHEILKMNVAAIAGLAGNGSAIFVDGFESGSTSGWALVEP